VTLGAEAAQHVKVLRLEPGAAVRLFDGAGHEADAELLEADAEQVLCSAAAAVRQSEQRPPVVLVQAMPKGSKLDGMVRMVTEIGVTAIHLCFTDRTVAKPDERRAKGRLERLERIAREASRQAGRSDVPELFAPAPLLDVARRAQNEATRLVLWDRGSRSPQQALANRPGMSPVWLIVGPEGGLSPAELEALEARSWAPVCLGPTTLRVETAAPVAVAVALDHLRGEGAYIQRQ
jgi:16S rRNA (uracil1498-N3)-methyltransferase